MHLRMVASLLVLLGLLLGGCAAFNPPEKQHREALDDFIYALRWQLYPEAAAFFVPAHGEPFLAQMEKLTDLNVTEVRQKRLEVRDEGLRVDTLLEMDYYILPSTTLKTLRINQTWRYFAPGTTAGGFLITTPFPAFP